jgi:hypothetical protein
MPDTEPIAVTESDADIHGHLLPDVDSEPVTYTYADGCVAIKHPDGSSEFIPNRER